MIVNTQNNVGMILYVCILWSTNNCFQPVLPPFVKHCLCMYKNT